MRSHGYITGVKPYGVFISFCGGMKGLAHTAELPLGPDQKPSEAYKVGQVGLGHCARQIVGPIYCSYLLPLKQP